MTLDEVEKTPEWQRQRQVVQAMVQITATQQAMQRGDLDARLVGPAGVVVGTQSADPRERSATALAGVVAGTQAADPREQSATAPAGNDVNEGPATLADVTSRSFYLRQFVVTRPGGSTGPDAAVDGTGRLSVARPDGADIKVLGQAALHGQTGAVNIAPAVQSVAVNPEATRQSPNATKESKPVNVPGTGAGPTAQELDRRARQHESQAQADYERGARWRSISSRQRGLMKLVGRVNAAGAQQAGDSHMDQARTLDKARDNAQRGQQQAAELSL